MKPPRHEIKHAKATGVWLLFICVICVICGLIVGELVALRRGKRRGENALQHLRVHWLGEVKIESSLRGAAARLTGRSR